MLDDYFEHKRAIIHQEYYNNINIDKLLLMYKGIESVIKRMMFKNMLEHMEEIFNDTRKHFTRDY
jgi:hypothetical protein